MDLSSFQKNPALISMNKAPSIDMAKIDTAARDFEAMFVSEMMKPMFESVEVNETFGGGKTEEIFRGFMVEEYGKMIADTGQLGIADIVKKQMIEMQEKADSSKLAQDVQGHNTALAPAKPPVTGE